MKANVNIEDDGNDTMSEEVTMIGEELIEDVKEEPVDLTVDQLDGVGAVTKKKLESFGIKNIIDIAVRGAKEVQEITGVDKAKANAWVFNSQKLLEDNNMIRKSDMTVTELMKYQENQERLSTKCEDVDNLFNGGLTSK